MIATIETERLFLVPLSIDCADMYDQFYTDEEASRAYGGPIASAAAWTRLNSDLGSWYLSGFGVWAIKRKKENDLMGTCGFWQGKGWPRELTWWLLPEARGKGIAYESSISVINHAYNEFNWDVVETYMNDQNSPARALVEKLGGVKIGRKVFPDGLMRDLYAFSKPG
jgi:RimJ/RimL family protein N-acetyltransferase